jgi:redox-sensitive bicupin YhaK (pirin superfamily)
LKSYHTFSFADYYDPQFESFGCLRVINEDTVAGGEGFGTHPHRDAEIFSYVISGIIEHKDSMGNTELLTRGQVQFTSAGTGIRHSEFNGDKRLALRFLQIWALPRQRGLTPRYETKTFGDEAKADKPDAFLVLSWNFLDFFIEKYASYLRGGGKFIVPHPTVRVIGSEAIKAANY